jgi:hypothetical protein
MEQASGGWNPGRPGFLFYYMPDPLKSKKKIEKDFTPSLLF